MKIIGGIIGFIIGCVITLVAGPSGIPSASTRGGVIVGCCVAGIILGAIIKAIGSGASGRYSGNTFSSSHGGAGEVEDTMMAHSLAGHSCHDCGYWNCPFKGPGSENYKKPNICHKWQKK